MENKIIEKKEKVCRHTRPTHLLHLYNNISSGIFNRITGLVWLYLLIQIIKLRRTKELSDIYAKAGIKEFFVEIITLFLPVPMNGITDIKMIITFITMIFISFETVVISILVPLQFETRAKITTGYYLPLRLYIYIYI